MITAEVLTRFCSYRIMKAVLAFMNMKKEKVLFSLSLKLLLLVLMLFGCGFLGAEKLYLKPKGKALPPKVHPFTKELRQAKPIVQRGQKVPNYEKLLVILVEFEEEIIDDPNTTGNGLFQLEADESYLYPIASPPHNRQYFEANLEAMRYYYLAASAGSYNLQYDVWPKDKPAYRLPNKMGYYNPPNASSSVFVSKMEEYFKDSFETADKDDPSLDFAAYGHYMIIHAGSDWQHDVFGDTPSDLPSFFIRVSEGKRVAVNNGSHYIYHACNVPETISQDFDSYTDSGITYHTGYGALNGVMFHEFGHSLGLVDLYNVYNSWPMVGVFDIMDSGGSGITLDLIDEQNYVELSGALPALPGAFSRALLFEVDFRSRGLMKDISSLATGELQKIAASSHKQGLSPYPTIYKYNLSPTEYFLIENRNVDPDQDGGTALKSALDGRVALYPTPYNSANDEPSYEYDWILPAFMTKDYDYTGGGLLFWYVNEDLIYNQGTIFDDGTFWSNFQNNTVNTSFENPGVMVLEADGLRDIGEPYSMFWTGSQYDYFYAHKPVLDNRGLFLRWSNEPWTPKLSSATKPSLTGKYGLGSTLYFDNISNPNKVMDFEVKTAFFDELKSFNFPGSYQAAPLVNNSLAAQNAVFYGDDGLYLISNMGLGWEDLSGQLSLDELVFDYPLQVVDLNDDGFIELIGVKGNKLKVISFTDDFPQLEVIELDGLLSEPFIYKNKVFVFNADELFVCDGTLNSYAFPQVKKLAAFDDLLLLLFRNELKAIDLHSDDLIFSLLLPDSFGDYEMVIAKQKEQYRLILTSDRGDIYSFSGGNLNKIFSNHSLHLPTNLALYYEDGAFRLFFGLGSEVHNMLLSGYSLPGFPYFLDDIVYEVKEHPKALKIDNDILLYLPIKNRGYLAFSADGSQKREASLFYPHLKENQHKLRQDYLFYDEQKNELNWYYSVDNENESTAYIHSLYVKENPILWDGFRNSNAGLLYLPEDSPATDPEAKLNAYIYPNPVKGNNFRLRLDNASDKTKLKILDISGKTVFAKEYETEIMDEIELSSHKLSSGVYLLNIKSGAKQKLIKFVVEK